MGQDLSSLSNPCGLETECALLRAFLELLEAEQAALVAGDIERAAILAQEKSVRADELERLAEARRRYLDSRASPSAGVHSPESPDNGIEAAWHEVLSLAAQAREVNRVNGLLIARRLSHSQRALALLYGTAAHSDLYGPDGRALAAGTHSRGMA